RLHAQGPDLDPLERTLGDGRAQALTGRGRGRRTGARPRMSTSRFGDRATDPGLREFENAVEHAAVGLRRPLGRDGYEEILVAYDGSPQAQAALARVPALVSGRTRVTVSAVIPFDGVGSRRDGTDPEQRAWQWKCLVDATAYLREFGIDPFIEAAEGRAAAVIRETAESLPADLVVLGQGRSRGRRRPLERQRAKPELLRRLRCDTLVVEETPPR